MEKSRRKPEFCVFEANPNGHRLLHVKILVEYLYRQTKTKPLFLTTRGVLDSAPYRANLREVENLFRAVPLEGSGKISRLRRVFQLRKAFRKLKAEEGVRTFLIPTSDHLVEAFGLASLCGFSFDGLDIRFGVLRLGIAYPGRKFLKKIKHAVAFFLQSRAPGLRIYLDEYAVRIVGEKRGIRLRSMPDPFLSFRLLRKTKTSGKKPRKGPVVLGMVGAIDERKGLALLMEALRFSEARKGAKLKLAGSFDESSKKILGEAQRTGGLSLAVLDRFLGEEEYWNILGEIDVVCLPYPSHIGPSAVYAQSAALGKVILASDFGWMGWEGRNHKKTIFFKNESVGSLREKLDYVVKNFDKLDKRGANYIPADPDKYAGIFTGLGPAPKPQVKEPIGRVCESFPL